MLVLMMSIKIYAVVALRILMVLVNSVYSHSLVMMMFSKLSVLQQRVFWLLLVVAVIALDQWTKTLASQSLTYGRAVEVLSVFDLTLLHNKGAAFSFLSDAAGWQRWFFTAISSVVSIILLVWLLRLKRDEVWLAASLAFILGGAIGNLWDRIALGHVVDFISVHYQDNYFPAFNIADSAITLGATIMILDMLISAKEKPSE
jgi:signal peptidase II